MTLANRPTNKPLRYRHWLVNARVKAKLSQGEIAEACGISRSAYQKYEYGQRTPKKETMVKIKKMIKITEV